MPYRVFLEPPKERITNYFVPRDTLVGLFPPTGHIPQLGARSIVEVDKLVLGPI